MNLLLLSSKDKISENLYSVTDFRKDHINEVLKLTVGSSIETAIINDKRYAGKIYGISPSEIQILLEPFTDSPRSNYLTVDVICALPRPQTLKKVLITCGTMNVRNLYLIRSNRVEKSYFQTPLLLPQNYTPYLIEGMSQGKNIRLPKVHLYNKFKMFFQDVLPIIAAENEELIKIVPHPETELNIYKLIKTNQGSIIIALGPEGGWVPFEIDLMKEAGFLPTNLGEFVLRVESAMTAALSQLELIKLIYNE